jgi:AcrR family transcriptional regulator
VQVGPRTAFVPNTVRYEQSTSQTVFVSSDRMEPVEAATPRRRSTRDRPAKPPLSEGVILDVALRILREEGLEAVTMRRLATELDTGAASLYVYISGRDELRVAMLGRLAGAIEFEQPDPAHWREQVHRLLLRTLHSFEEHPGIAMVAVGNPPVTDEVMLYLENLLSLLHAGGIHGRDAAWACDILPLIVTAAAVEIDVHRARRDNEAQFVAGLAAAFAALPRERFPTIRASLGDLTAGAGDDRFVYAVDVFLDGLAARAARG